MEITIQIDSTDKQLELFGPADSFLRLLRQSLDVQIIARQSRLMITGKEDNVKKAAGIVDKMQKHLTKHRSLTAEDVTAFIKHKELHKILDTGKAISVYSHKKVIEPTTKGQLKYIETMLANDLTFVSDRQEPAKHTWRSQLPSQC